MKSISFAKLLTLGCFALLLPVACGDDDDDAPNPPVGSSGAGGEAEGGAPSTPAIPGTGPKQTIECGTDSCTSTATALGANAFIDPCCAEGATACGVDSGFLTLIGVDLKGACIPKEQPGTVDSGCPSTEKTTVPYAGQMVGVEGFKGCCRPDNTCGFLVDTVDTDLGVAFAAPGLGCVDPKTFGATGTTPCGGGEGGSGGGGGGAGGSDGLGGMSSEGGAPVGGGGAGGAP